LRGELAREFGRAEAEVLTDEGVAELARLEPVMQRSVRICAGAKGRTQLAGEELARLASEMCRVSWGIQAEARLGRL
jgi:hypothetical protein